MSDENTQPPMNEENGEMSEEDRLLQALEAEEAQQQKANAEGSFSQPEAAQSQNESSQTQSKPSTKKAKGADKGAEQKQTGNAKANETKSQGSTSGVEAKNFHPNTQSTQLSGFIHQLDEYIGAMDPNRRRNQEQLISAQRQLNSLVRTLFNFSQQRFDEAMKVLISAVREHRSGVFHESRCMAGFNNLTINRSERQRLEMLINILHAAADSQNPREINHTVNLNVAFRYFTQDNQSLLRGYFTS